MVRTVALRSHGPKFKSTKSCFFFFFATTTSSTLGRTLGQQGNWLLLPNVQLWAETESVLLEKRDNVEVALGQRDRIEVTLGCGHSYCDYLWLTPKLYCCNKTRHYILSTDSPIWWQLLWSVWFFDKSLLLYFCVVPLKLKPCCACPCPTTPAAQCIWNHHTMCATNSIKVTGYRKWAWFKNNFAKVLSVCNYYASAATCTTSNAVSFRSKPALQESIIHKDNGTQQ